MPRPFVQRVGLLAVVGLLLLAAPAQAHTLWKQDAALAARIALDEFAEHRFGDHSYPSLTRYDCRRRSRHVVRCTGTFEYEDFDQGFTRFCTAYVTVRLEGYRTRERVHRPVDCF